MLKCPTLISERKITFINFDRCVMLHIFIFFVIFFCYFFVILLFFMFFLFFFCFFLLFSSGQALHQINNRKFEGSDFPLFSSSSFPFPPPFLLHFFLLFFSSPAPSRRFKEGRAVVVHRRLFRRLVRVIKQQQLRILLPLIEHLTTPEPL